MLPTRLGNATGVGASVNANMPPVAQLVRCVRWIINHHYGVSCRLMKALELFVEAVLFRSRWLLAPFFIGLVVATLALMTKFFKELWYLVSEILSMSGADVIISILSLVDTTLIAVLMFIIILSGYESFVSRIDFNNHEDRPDWMGKVGFSELKLKLIGAIVAISAVELLKAFIEIDSHSNAEMAWKVGIHMAFVVSGVLFALTDYISARKSGGH